MNEEMKTVFTNSKETNVMVWAKFDLVSKNLNKEWANQLVTYFCKKSCRGTSPVIQWLRLHALNAGSPSSIPGQGTRSRMPHLRVCVPQLKISQMQQRSKILSATTRTRCSQINKQTLFKAKWNKVMATHSHTHSIMYCL